MGIQTKKMSEWLAANGQAITNASKATMEDAIRADIGQLYDGVFIMFHSKRSNIPLAVRVSSWASYQNSGEIAGGVLLVESGRYLVIAPTEGNLKKWSSKPVSSSDVSGSVLIKGVTTTNNKAEALNDFAGRANTTAIINGSTSSNVTNTEAYASGFCNKYSRTNANGNGLTAGKWWLPSIGEITMIYSNFDKINYALSMISGATQLQTEFYWASTQYSNSTAWGFKFDDHTMYAIWKSDTCRIRPVSTFFA